MIELRRFATTLLAAAMVVTSGCSEDPEQPTPTTSGPLVVTLTTPASDDGAILVRVSGAPIDDAVSMASDRVFHFPATGATSIRAVVAGDLASGPLFEVAVPDGSNPADYEVTILEVADRDNELRTDLSGYALTIGAS